MRNDRQAKEPQTGGILWAHFQVTKIPKWFALLAFFAFLVRILSPIETTVDAHPGVSTGINSQRKCLDQSESGDEHVARMHIRFIGGPSVIFQRTFEQLPKTKGHCRKSLREPEIFYESLYLCLLAYMMWPVSAGVLEGTDRGDVISKLLTSSLN